MVSVLPPSHREDDLATVWREGGGKLPSGKRCEGRDIQVFVVNGDAYRSEMHQKEHSDQEQQQKRGCDENPSSP